MTVCKPGWAHVHVYGKLESKDGALGPPSPVPDQWPQIPPRVQIPYFMCLAVLEGSYGQLSSSGQQPVRSAIPDTDRTVRV